MILYSGTCKMYVKFYASLSCVFICGYEKITATIDINTIDTFTTSI